MTGGDQETLLTRYMHAFNGGDFDALGKFYCPDVRLTNGAGRELVGRDAIFVFYRQVRSMTHRTIHIVQHFGDNRTIAAELKSEFVAVVDAPDFPSGAMRQGDRLSINSFVFYTLRDGRFCDIRAAVFRRNWQRQSAG